MNPPFDAIERSRAADVKSLRLVSVFHYVAGGLIGLFASFFVVHIVLGVAALKSHDANSPLGDAAPFFIGIGAGFVTVGWTMAGLVAYAGRCLARRERHRFCMVVAGLSIPWFPLGSALGIFTLVLLGKPHIKALFDGNALPVPPGFPPGFAPAPPPPPVAAPPVDTKGWRSAEAKAAFSRQVGLVLAGVFGVQILLVIASVGVMTAGAVTTPMAIADVGGAARWGGRIWYIETAPGFGSPGSRRLASIDPASSAAPVAGPVIPAASTVLAADGPTLWILGPGVLARYDGGEVTVLPKEDAPRHPSRSFVHEGRPAIFDWGRTTIDMWSPEGSGWSRVPGSSRFISRREPGLPQAWTVLPSESGFDIVADFFGTLRSCHLDPSDGTLPEPARWDRLGGTAFYFAAVSRAGGLVVYQPKMGVFDRDVSVLRHTDLGWQNERDLRVRASGSIAALPDESGALDLVLDQAGAIETVRLSESGEVVAERTRTSPVVAAMMSPRWIALWIGLSSLPVLLGAAWVARLMRRDRDDAVDGDPSLRYASLLQRAAAHAIDVAPWSVVVLVWCWRILRSAPAFTPRTLLGPALAGTAGWLVTGVLWACTEGLWGVSPGKWLVGIRVVGEDLGPCGVGRALARSALRLIDGMMNFAVGIVAVAFSPRWQRLGDTAAKTLVVRARAKGAPAGSST